MCAGAGISASSRLSVKSSNHSGRSRKRSFESVESLAGFRDQFPGASSSLRSEVGLDDVLDGVLDESCDGDVEDELTIQEQQEVRNCPFCRESSSLVWSTVVSDR